MDIRELDNLVPLSQEWFRKLDYLSRQFIEETAEIRVKLEKEYITHTPYHLLSLQ